MTLDASYKRSQSTGSAVNVRRLDLLALTLDEYKANADSVERGLGRAARLLNRLHILDRFNLPYGTQLIPLAAVCACLGDAFERDSVHTKLARWYWCGVVGELYGGANETRYAWDIQDLMAWITNDGSAAPRTVGDAELSPMRLLGLQTRQSAAYKGLFALTVCAGSLDFRHGDPTKLTTRAAIPVGIHHIFPRAWYRRNGIDEWTANCVVNKAPSPASRIRFLVELHRAATSVASFAKATSPRTAFTRSFTRTSSTPSCSGRTTSTPSVVTARSSC